MPHISKLSQSQPTATQKYPRQRGQTTEQRVTQEDGVVKLRSRLFEKPQEVRDHKIKLPRLRQASKCTIKPLSLSTNTTVLRTLDH